MLETLFAEAEAAYAQNELPKVDAEVEGAAEVLFRSPTQSCREVLLGCGLARLLDRSINIRHPYVSHGNDAFNGRTLDECVVNPFLREKLIPVSKGPYLAVFRRSVKLLPETASGLRDKEGYRAMMSYMEALEQASPDEARTLVLHLLYR